MLKRRGDEGFTLIELLITVVIMGVIIAPLANAVIGVIHNTTDTKDRLLLSHDQQIAAAYFSQDVAGLGVRDSAQPDEPLQRSVQLNAAYNAGPTCGTAATPTSLIRFLFDDYDESTVPAAKNSDVVAYYVLPVTTESGAERQLHRIKCLGPGTTPASDVVLVHDLDASDPVITCAQPTTCIGPTPPQSITMSLSLVSNKTTYSVTLNGQRRQL